MPLKGILKPARGKFPEEQNPVREGVAAPSQQDIPPEARWIKIDRRLVNPAALEAGRERFEERSEYIIVLRVLTKEEVQEYAIKTQGTRGMLWLVVRGLTLSRSISLNNVAIRRSLSGTRSRKKRST